MGLLVLQLFAALALLGRLLFASCNLDETYNLSFLLVGHSADRRRFFDLCWLENYLLVGVSFSSSVAEPSLSP